MTSELGGDALAYSLVGVVALQRLGELVVARRNGESAVAAGFIEVASHQMPFFVVLHAGFLVAVVVEVARFGSAWTPVSLLWAAVFLGAQGLRVWCIRSLGRSWNTRILVCAGMTLVRVGPYRRIRHPNYVAVALEFVSIPLMVGAWRTALVFSVLNLVMMRWRIPTEERAIREWASPEAWTAYEALPRFVPRVRA